MADLTDNDGQPIFIDSFDHRQMMFEDMTIDIVETNGNIWLNGADILAAMGFQPHHKGGFGRMLKRIDHPDIIKITDTSFRFSDGRRNRGSFISPRAVVQFADGKTQGRNPIKITSFVTWLDESVLIEGRDADGWSPAKKMPISLEPVFHQIIKAVTEDQQGRELDPLRTVRANLLFMTETPIRPDEYEFCICPQPWEGMGKCWCHGRGGLRQAVPEPFVPYDGLDVIDLEDASPSQPGSSQTSQPWSCKPHPGHYPRLSIRPS